MMIIIMPPARAIDSVETTGAYAAVLAESRRNVEGKAPRQERRASDRRVVRTKRAIREALFSLMRTTDYDKVTIAALAREADIDRKTFYLHYSSVDDVVEELVREEAEREVEALRREALAQGEGIDVAALFTQLSVAAVREFPLDGRMMRPVSTDLLLEKLEAPLVDAVLEEDVLGLAAAVGPERTRLCISFFCAGLLAVYRRWLDSDSEIPLEDVAAMSSTAVVAGAEGLLRGYCRGEAVPRP